VSRLSNPAQVSGTGVESRDLDPPLWKSVEALVAVQEGDKKFPVTMVRYIVGTASIAFKEIQPPGSASSRGTR